MPDEGLGFSDLGNYCWPAINYSICRWPVPDRWQDGTTNWASSNPGPNHSVRITDPYLKTQPVRIACMWNTGGNVGVPPDGSAWIDCYTHRCKGVNAVRTDGSARWIVGGKIIPYQQGPVYHWRNAFWKYTVEMLE